MSLLFLNILQSLRDRVTTVTLSFGKTLGLSAEAGLGTHSAALPPLAHTPRHAAVAVPPMAISFLGQSGD